MQLDERDLVSATELNRNPGRFIAAAADGRRLIVMSNNVPTAAIVGMADLRRLDDLDDDTKHPGVVAFDAEPPQLADLTSSRTPGTTVIGVDVDGSVVTLPIEAHHVVVGATGSGLSNALSAFIAGATPAATAPLEFLVLTGRFAVARHHDVDPATAVAVATDLGTESEAQRLITLLESEVSERTEALRRRKATTLAEARVADSSLATVPDLVIVVDQTFDLDPALRNVLERLVRERVGLSIYVWTFDQKPPRGVNSIEAQLNYRVALQTASAADSRELIGSTDAHSARLPTGGGFVQTADRSSPATYVRLVGPDLRTDEWPSANRPGSWLPPLPDDVDFDVVNDMWQTAAGGGDSERFVVPIGLLDDLAARRHTVYTLDLSPGQEAVCVCSANAATDLDTIVSAIVNATAYEDVQIYYLGAIPITAGPSQHVAEAAVWANPDQVAQFVAAVDALMKTPVTPRAPRAVVVIDDVKRLRLREFEFHARLMTHQSRVQLILGAQDSFALPPTCGIGRGVLLELPDIGYTNSTFSRPLRRLLPRDGSATHALTARGLLLIAQPARA